MTTPTNAPMRLKVLIVAVALLISPLLQATGADTGTVPPVDLAACMAAIADGDEAIVARR